MTIFYKTIFKAYEKILRLRTFLLNSGQTDPTAILIDSMTPAQVDALQSYVPPLPTLKATNPYKLMVVIPFKDRWEMTHTCLRQLVLQARGNLPLKIVLVDNGSKEAATREGLAKADAWMQTLANVECHILSIESAFNFSRLNNEAVRHFATEEDAWLLFLNNDVEILTSNSLERMVAFYDHQPNVGALGCTLLYPNHTIQHLFAAPGVKIVAAHPLKGLALNKTWQWFSMPRPVPAVTGAALLIGREKFLQAGMLEERLPAHGQDIDLCLKLQMAGYVNWALTDCYMIHHESASRKADIDWREVDWMYQRWGAYLQWNPFYSKQLSRWTEFPTLSWFEKEYPWKQVLPPHKKPKSQST